MINRAGRGRVSLAERLRHPKARFNGEPAAVRSIGLLGNARYLLLESERRDGTQVGTPMFFAILDEAIVVRTEAESAKVTRIRDRPIVRVGPCSVRGKPLAGYFECMARFLPLEKQALAEAALRRKHLLCRQEWFLHQRYVYLELTPLAGAGREAPEDEAIAAGVRALHESRRKPHDQVSRDAGTGT
jgi:PPOX class probable F420-dependent enzyme